MKIWVDADACPKVIKDILYRAAERKRVELILVANQPLAVPPSLYIKAIQVSSGFDVADHYITQSVESGDLVVTADIPLAADIVDKGALGLNPRGTIYDPSTIREALTVRNFMEQMRSIGEASGGPPPFDLRDRQAFANALDRLLARLS